MAGIYVHIPYCKKACNYCNFHFSTSLQTQNDFLEALLKEVRMQQPYLEGATVDTIYFGGGTPSLLSPQTIGTILTEIRTHFPIARQAELTLEANPDDIIPGRPDEWLLAGINRLSIGIQSFHEEDLQWMNRAHSVKQAIDCLALARPLFANITIDLIYGHPLLTDEKWAFNVHSAIQMGIPHLSCYGLTKEEGTLLHHQIQKGICPGISPDDQARQFEWLINKLAMNGYEHYEISNFAKPGFRSRHNSNYWSGNPYLGLGPAAHSFNGRSRQWNIANNGLYIQSINNNSVPAEIELLTPIQQVNEYIMTSLRTTEGLDLHKLAGLMQGMPAPSLGQAIEAYVEAGQLEKTANGIRLSQSGKLFADGIAAALFLEEPPK